MEIKYIFDNAKDLVDKEVNLNGWIRNHRPQKSLVLLIFLMELVLNIYKLFMIIL